MKAIELSDAKGTLSDYCKARRKDTLVLTWRGKAGGRRARRDLQKAKRLRLSDRVHQAEALISSPGYDPAERSMLA